MTVLLKTGFPLFHSRLSEQHHRFEALSNPPPSARKSCVSMALRRIPHRRRPSSETELEFKLFFIAGTIASQTRCVCFTSPFCLVLLTYLSFCVEQDADPREGLCQHPAIVHVLKTIFAGRSLSKWSTPQGSRIIDSFHPEIPTETVAFVLSVVRLRLRWSILSPFFSLIIKTSAS